MSCNFFYLKHKFILFSASLIVLINSGKAMSMEKQRSHFLSSGVFFGPSTADTYSSPALDLELELWETNKKIFFSWGLSAEVWYFSSVMYEENKQKISNNTDVFLNMNTMFFYDTELITPFISPSVALASDFKDVGFSAGGTIGILHKTSDKLQTFVQTKYIRFSKELNYLDMYFFMVGFSLELPN